MKKPIFLWIKIIATLVSAGAALGIWLLPRESTTRVEVAILASSPHLEAEKDAKRREATSSQEEGRIGVPKAVSQEVANGSDELRARSDAASWEFDLADNEQKVILSGRASVAVQFNDVSGEYFMTLLVGVGEASTPYPVLSAGKKVRFNCGGQDYLVSVLALDIANKTARLRVDSES